MKQRLLRLLQLAMQAKQYNIDVFFSYSPHVNAVQLDIHKRGWHADNTPDMRFSIYYSGSLAGTKAQTIANLKEATDYILEVIESVKPV